MSKSDNRNSLAPKLEIGETIPYLSLPSSNAKEINLWDLRQRKNLVLFFNHGITCNSCLRKMLELSNIFEELSKLDTMIFAVSSDQVESLRDFQLKNVIRFPILSDVSRIMGQRFVHLDNRRQSFAPTVLVTDRFGVLRFQNNAEEANELVDNAEIISWISYIESECPECSH